MAPLAANDVAGGNKRNFDDLGCGFSGPKLGGQTLLLTLHIQPVLMETPGQVVE